VHDTCTPKQLLFLIKDSHRQGQTIYVRDQTQPPKADGLRAAANDLIELALDPTDKFCRLNECLIEANFLDKAVDRYYVFANVLLAKAAILADHTPTLRQSPSATVASMHARRRWASFLAARAAKYAKIIHSHDLVLRSLHAYAVGYNARGNAKKATQSFFAMLQYAEAHAPLEISQDIQSAILARNLRERAVCLAKANSNSNSAAHLVTQSMEIVEAEGTPHEIDDTHIRCCEVFTYLNQQHEATKHLDFLQSALPRMNPNLKAMTMKVSARFFMTFRELNKAEESLATGVLLASQHSLFHQQYMLRRLHAKFLMAEYDTRSI
jgi:hypothetical protein